MFEHPSSELIQSLEELDARFDPKSPYWKVKPHSIIPNIPIDYFTIFPVSGDFLSSAKYLCKQFGTRSGPTFCRS